MATLDQLVRDIKALEKAASTTGGIMLPDKLRAETVGALKKLLAILGGEGYQKPGYEKPGDYQKPEHPKTVTDRTREKALKVKFADKSVPVAEAAKAAQVASSNVARAPVSSQKYATVVQAFGEAFASRYYVASTVKSGDGDWPKENTWDNLVRPSAETLAERARAKAQQVEIERRIAAEEAERRRQTAGFASYWNSPS